MIKVIVAIFLTVFSTRAFAQINLNDSTAQVISYWNLGDSYSYSISLQKLKIKDQDTTSNEFMTYSVDVSVVDSTENSYDIEWFYHNYQTNSTNEIIKKITALAEDLKIVIETDELGTIKGVKNWEDVTASIKKSLEPIRDEYKNIPQLGKVFDQLETMYNSKAGIENMAIQDIQQFHFFHGGKYALGEVNEYATKVPNGYNPNEELDSRLTLYLDEINSDDNNFIMRSKQEVDAEQLMTVAKAYLNSLSKTMGAAEFKLDDFGKMTNLTTTDSRIHGTGWLIYSIQTKTVEGAGVKNVEERIIELN